MLEMALLCRWPNNAESFSHTSGSEELHRNSFMEEVRLNPELELGTEMAEGGGGFPKPGLGCAEAAELWGPQGSSTSEVDSSEYREPRANLRAHGSWD